MPKVVIPIQSTLGTAAAENDDFYFSECFVDTGLIDQLLSPLSAQSIVAGRTGSGKSAILRKIEETSEHVCILNPETLSLGFLADSWLLNFLTTKDVDLGLFYQQLWRHVLVIELLRYEKNLESEYKVKSFIQSFSDIFKDNTAKLRAFEYLTKYGGQFWEDTELRVRHIAQAFEDNLSAEMGASFAGIRSKIEAGSNVSQTESSEIISNARKIVNSIQMQELSKIIDILNEDVFDDKKRQVILLIDNLDLQWADSRIQMKLIEALVNVIPKFRKIQNIKIIIAMRDDLIDQVLSQASTPGFQREKFADQYKRIVWNKDNLKLVVNRRVKKLYKSQYTNESIDIDDILADQVSHQETFDYIFDRTMMRPRDVLSYFNKLFDKFAGKTELLQKDIRSIELDYSTDRRRALVDEWSAMYPFANLAIGFLGHKKLSSEFRFGNVDKDIIDELVLNIITKHENDRGDLVSKARAHFNGGNDTTREAFFRSLIAVLYRIGAIGIKTQANSRVEFSFISRPLISGDELGENTPCLVHPMLWQNLGRRGESKGLFT